MAGKSFSHLIALADQLTDGMILYDLQVNKILYANPPAHRITNLKQHDGLETIQSVWRTVAVEDRAYVSSQLGSVLAQRGSQVAEFALAHESTRIFVQAKACVIENGTLLIIFLQDISELKRHEDYLVELGARKNTLLDTLTHNLSGSLTLTENLASQAARTTGEETRKLLGLIRENTVASLKIIEDFVSFEHEKSPRIVIKAARIDVIEKLHYLYEQMVHSYPERTFKFSSSRPVIHATTDEVKLLQVVNNLLSNAIKFSKADTDVTLNIEAHANTITITVIDQGIGIPDALKPLIFLPQPLTGRPGLKGEPSNGKGLVICKQLVDMLSGSIRFESQEGKGSTFIIQLPYTIPLEGISGII